MINIINAMKEMLQQATPTSSMQTKHNSVAENLDYYRLESEEVIKNRIDELQGEWDVERCVEFNASVIGLSGLVLGAALSKKWLVLPAAVCSYLIVHALKGSRFPSINNLRTRQQIAEEQYGLKALLNNGSYKNLDSNNF